MGLIQTIRGWFNMILKRKAKDEFNVEAISTDKMDAFIKKCINILFFQSGRNEIRFLCNFTDCIKYFVYDIVLTQTATNFLHAVFSLCVFIL